MIYKRIPIIILIISYVFISVSCSGPKENNEPPIRIYRTSFDEMVMEAVELFRKNHNTEVNEVVFSNMDEYYGQVANELLKGSGPDVILIDPFSRGADKLLLEGAFLDMGELLKSDEDIASAGYNQAVMNGFTYDDKRFLIPISYSVNAFASTRQMADGMGSGADDGGISVAELQEMIKKGGNDSGRAILDSSFSFTDMLISNGISSTSFYAGTGSFYDGTLTDMLKSYKALYSAMNKESNDPGQLLRDKKCTFVHIDDASNPNTLLKDYSAGKYGDMELSLYNAASDNGGTYAAARIMAGINKNSKNPRAAFDFIKMLLSKDVQSMDSFIYTPVNQEAYQLKIGKYLNNRNAEKVAEDIKKFQSNITGAAYISFDIEQILRNEIKGYLDDQKTAEETGENIRIAVNSDNEKGKSIEENSEDHSGDTSTAPDSGSPIADTDKKKMKMFLYHYGTMEAVDAVRRFNMFSPDMEIDVESTKSRDEFTNKFTASVMAGEGPDIIIAEPKLVPSINNMIRNDVFADLNYLIENDPEFEPGDYYEQILDSGLYQGKRYYIPCRFSLAVLYTTDEILEQNNISIDESDWTWDRMLEIADRIGEAGEDKYLFTELEFYDLLRSSEPFIDYEKRSTRFDTEDFIELLDIYRKLHKYVCPPEEIDRYDGISELVLSSGKVIFLKDEGCPVQSFGNNSRFIHYMNQEARMYLMPSVKKGKGTFADAELIAGINARSKYKEEAYKYIKILLNDSLTDELDRSMPVREKSYSAIKNHYISMGGNAGYISDSYGNQINGTAIPQAHIDLLDGWIGNITRCNITDTSVKEIIDEQLEKFLDGKSDSKQTAKVINDKIRIFLNE